MCFRLVNHPMVGSIANSHSSLLSSSRTRHNTGSHGIRRRRLSSSRNYTDRSISRVGSISQRSSISGLNRQEDEGVLLVQIRFDLDFLSLLKLIMDWKSMYWLNPDPLDSSFFALLGREVLFHMDSGSSSNSSIEGDSRADDDRPAGWVAIDLVWPQI